MAYSGTRRCWQVPRRRNLVAEAIEGRVLSFLMIAIVTLNCNAQENVETAQLFIACAREVTKLGAPGALCRPTDRVSRPVHHSLSAVLLSTLPARTSPAFWGWVVNGGRHRRRFQIPRTNLKSAPGTTRPSRASGWPVR